MGKFPLTDTEWNWIWNQAARQTVRGVLYDGICRLQDAYLPPEELLIRWTAEIAAIESRNRKMNRVLFAHIQQMHQVGVDPILLKGQGVAQFYPQPLWRECGDIDFCFRTDLGMRKALEWGHRNGFDLKKEPDGAYSFDVGGFVIEYHQQAFDAYASRTRTCVENMFLNAKQRLSQLSIPISSQEKYSCTVLSPMFNLLSLNLHILKHVMGHGVGLRQFCDIARAYEVLHNQIDAGLMENIYKQCGLLRWCSQLHVFLTKYIGLKPFSLPYQEFAVQADSRLLKIVLSGGNFGQGNGEQTDIVRWKRKLQTLSAFLQHLGFSLRYAPHELFGQVGHLLGGNIK